MPPSNRREFVKKSSLAATGLVFTACQQHKDQNSVPKQSNISNRPVVISTWVHGLAANEAAWIVLKKGGSSIDAVEAGVRVTEADPTGQSVGIGGRPDQSGTVTLDACIMNSNGDCGSVAYLKNIMHPISVARKVMEETPHVMLVGQGAYEFAISKGFEPTNLLTEKSKKDYEKWLASVDKSKLPKINVENHDTIGLLAVDTQGNISGACTTSGAAWKLPGRVGDSPIIGAGLYVDNEIGGATATGWGEAVIRAVGCFLVVELMRQGHHPQKACELAVQRVIDKNEDWRDIQVGFIAVNKAGQTGAYCVQSGFNYAVMTDKDQNKLIDSEYKI